MEAFIILVLILLLLWSLYYLFRRDRLPPGPISLPGVGSWFFVKEIRRKRPHIALLDASKKYGDVFSFRMGSQLIVALNGYDVINEALVKQAHVFSDRPNHLPSVQNIMKDGGGIILQGYGQKWKALRKFTLQTLRDLGVGKMSIRERIAIEIEAAANVFRATKGEPFDISEILQKMIGNIIYGIIFGKRYEFNDPDFEIIRRMCDTVVAGQGLSNPANFFPRWVTKLIAKKANKEIEIRINIVRDIKNFILNQIQEHEDTFDEKNIRDFLDLYIQVSRDAKDGTDEHPITKENMLRIILELFIVGVETTSTALTWGFLFLSEYPEIQERCRREIDENVGDKIIEYSDRLKLPYVKATVIEILRLSNASPLGAPHCTAEETTFRGYRIPKRTLIMNNIYSATLDPKHWENPTQFNPERFIDSEGNYKENEAFIPFSCGPRICLGETFAKMEVFLVMSSLLQEFTFEKENANVKHSMKPKPHQVTNAPIPFKLRINQR